jgi:hypothetical protein
VEGIDWHRRHGTPVEWKRRLTQNLFRARIEYRLHRLCERFRFATLSNLLWHAV